MSRTLATAPFGAITVHRLVTAARDLGQRYRTWAERRATAAALRQLNQHQLADIGLIPGDIENFERTGRL
ncbi:MAG: DUF1127 domain-containing protein [Pseudomonadota bacterium]